MQHSSGIDIVFSVDGNAYQKKVAPVPETNAAKTYCFLSKVGKPDKISVAPIVKSGNTEKLLSITASINQIPKGRYPDNALILETIGTECSKKEDCIPPTGKENPRCVDSQCVYDDILVCTPTTEVCDGVDNNCNEHVDEGNLCSGGLCISGSCLSSISNLVAYWKFEDNALDSSGNGFTLINDGVTFISSGCGKSANASTYTRFYTRDTNPRLQPINGTISLLVYPKDVASGARIIYSGYNSGTGLRHPDLSMQGNNLTLILSDNVIWEVHKYISDDLINKWTYITVTWNGTSVKFYINGTLKQTDPQAIVPFGNQGWTIVSSDTDPAKAYIDELRLYDKALSAPEVAGLYGSVAGCM